jgi:hypothetical protein
MKNEKMLKILGFLALSNLKMKVMLTVLALFICEQAGLFATF